MNEIQLREVRGIVSFGYGCFDRTQWFPAGSPEATKALHELVKNRSGVIYTAWEYRGAQHQVCCEPYYDPLSKTHLRV